MSDRRVRNLVMLTVLFVWAVYLLTSMLLRGEAPEKWAWGIAPGVYAALYGPWKKKEAEQDEPEPERRPARRRRPQPAAEDD